MTTLTAPRLLAVPAPDLPTHQRMYGPVPTPGATLVATLEAAGLTGHGGAGFPTWRKLAAVARGSRTVVVANGAEGEPASAKDRLLLTRSPHLVLDGLRLAAEAVGAHRAYVYVSRAAVHAVSTALAERRDRVPVELVVAPDRFVAGEESAVVSAIEGRAALPRDKRRLIVESGVNGRPTLVQNVETLAHIALIARYGAGWFRAEGTADEPGTFLATISGAVAAPGVVELPYGIPLAEALTRAGGPTVPLRAVLVGGYHGAWLPAERDDVPLSRAALRPFGASPGAGVLIALPDKRCGIRESARIARYLAQQSAAQCGPCRFGLPRLADTLDRLARCERDPRTVSEIQRLTGLVTQRGACHHPDGTARFVHSSLAAFADEVHHHLAGHCIEESR
jgi:NADH:ubiquinone oxidoreductase subunit F (NADH-binding)